MNRPNALLILLSQAVSRFFNFFQLAWKWSLMLIVVRKTERKTVTVVEITACGLTGLALMAGNVIKTRNFF